ncbi:MAG: class I SAM-dependent methyltransferase [Rariglobus sp.]|nr:class I SAM-dependent methyltransferase [Rariglobus sp.]
MDALGYIDCGDNRDRIVFPWLRELITAKNPSNVLDFGCGDARFALQLSRLVPAQIAAYERDPHMREQARLRIAAESGNVTLCEQPSAGWTKKFDAIFLQGVWMCWSTRAECLDTLRLLARSLAPGGLLIASVTHPCFRDQRFATYRTDFNRARYLDNGVPFTVFVGTPGAETPIVDTHWNIEDTLNQALEAGLTLTRVKEHADGPAGTLPSWISFVFTPSPGAIFE